MNTVASNLIVSTLCLIAAAVSYFLVNNIYIAIFALCLTLYGLLRALFFHLLRSQKGREILKKIPIKKIQEIASK